MRNTAWEEVTRLYSACRLTFGTDKLPAISRVASAMQKKLQARYLADLWDTETLSRQLCWRCIDGEQAPRPAEYRAPSWSWASVDSGVIPGNTSKTYTVEVFRDDRILYIQELYYIHVRDITAHTTLSGSNPFDAVSEGSLILTCEHLLPLTNYEASQRPTDDLGFCELPSNWAIGNQSIRTSMIFDFSTEKKDMLYFLLINSSHYKENHMGEGLILKMTAVIPGQYRRVGYVEKRDFATRVLYILQYLSCNQNT